MAEYSEICAELGDSESGRRHRLELGRLYAEELNQVSDAVAEYRVVLSHDPKNAIAVRLGSPIADVMT